MNALLTVASAATAADDIRDIRGPILAAPAHAWWPYVIVGLAVVVLALATRFLIRRFRRALTPDERALLELEGARASIEGGDAQGFSTRVSAAVRTYVENAFALHAPRLTTEELLGTLMTEQSPVSSHRSALGTFLEFCDLAKYARWSLSRADMLGMLDSAETFVRATAGGAS